MNIIRKYSLETLGIALGALAGYLYYHFIGCSTGSCPISSSPLGSILYGTLWGWVLTQTFKTTKKENDERK
jgi:F0F1-type ATP synthase assembly protein I